LKGEASGGVPAGEGPGGGEGGVRGETALEIHVKGVVQGVGFRPFVHRLALRHRLVGWVRNEAGEVRIRVQGGAAEVEGFLRALPSEGPPLARIDSLEAQTTGLESLHEFQVAPSPPASEGRLPVSPDVAICGPCESELRDPGDRRFRYPFITCTDCGPRFTVIQELPYDRVRTSMGAFTQCPACQAEYGDPTDRRYHSETNSCPECGPRIWFEEGEAVVEGTDAALKRAAEVLAAGGILAIRGLGGFHLAVDATNDAAVRRLRERKGRDEKPLAVMARDLAHARLLGRVGPEEERLLASAERPIVLLEEGPGSGPEPSPAAGVAASSGSGSAQVPSRGLAPAVAPGLGTVGVMIPYTPLHHLTMDALAEAHGGGAREEAVAGTLAGSGPAIPFPLVMTSGNASDEPIATGNQEARERLKGIADAFLLHDREIVARYDDSVVRVVDGAPTFIRRARGYAPLPVSLPFPSSVPLLGVGPHLKNTFALAHGDTVFVSQHVGDLETLETLEHFRASLARFRALFRVEPQVVVRDLHPGYLSTRMARELAEEWDLPEPLAVQHHHAHVAAVAAEHGVEGPVVGVAFDGTGYGDDGAVWGGEILVADLRGYRRVGHLKYAPMPGGEAAIRHPWRMALGYASLVEEMVPGLALEGIPENEADLALTQIRRGLNAPLTSSMGRLFDGAAAVLGIRRHVGYEGQAAMELEGLAARGSGVQELDFPFRRTEKGIWVMDPVPLLAELGEGARRGGSVEDLAAGFHRAVAATTSTVVAEVCEGEGLETVALGGGVFQNALLTGLVARRLRDLGLRVLFPRALGPNDGAISYGQVAVGAAWLRDGGWD
jgi:hydrogenase maturation protein HypF